MDLSIIAAEVIPTLNKIKSKNWGCPDLTKSEEMYNTMEWLFCHPKGPSNKILNYYYETFAKKEEQWDPLLKDPSIIAHWVKKNLRGIAGIAAPLRRLRNQIVHMTAFLSDFLAVTESLLEFSKQKIPNKVSNWVALILYSLDLFYKKIMNEVEEEPKPATVNVSSELVDIHELLWFKKKGWAKVIKGATFIINEEPHIGKKLVFSSWSGKIANVTMDGREIKLDGTRRVTLIKLAE